MHNIDISKIESKQKTVDRLGSDDDELFEQENDEDLYQIQEGDDLIAS